MYRFAILWHARLRVSSSSRVETRLVNEVSAGGLLPTVCIPSESGRESFLSRHGDRKIRENGHRYVY